MSADPPRQPSAVLFACNFNRVRSPMAEALLKKAAGDRIYVDSCGLTYPSLDPEVLAEVDPFVAAVMAEVGCDLTGHRVKTFDELADSSFDLVISLTPESQRQAIAQSRRRASEVEYWEIGDPTLAEGSRDVRLGAYRAARDELAKLIAERFGE